PAAQDTGALAASRYRTRSRDPSVERRATPSTRVRCVEPMLVITNADAGTADDVELERALTFLRRHASVEVAETSNPGELDGVLHRAGSRVIVVAGGDGSLHAVIAALHRRNQLADTTLGLLPMGTGNDFARG